MFGGSKRKIIYAIDRERERERVNKIERKRVIEECGRNGERARPNRAKSYKIQIWIETEEGTGGIVYLRNKLATGAAKINTTRRQSGDRRRNK